MRHTRNRQLNKAYKTKEFTGDENYQLKWDYIKTMTGIDMSFKWHRGGTYMSWVEFKPNLKETKLIPAK